MEFQHHSAIIFTFERKKNEHDKQTNNRDKQQKQQQRQNSTRES